MVGLRRGVVRVALVVGLGSVLPGPALANWTLRALPGQVAGLTGVGPVWTASCTQQMASWSSCSAPALSQGTVSCAVGASGGYCFEWVPASGVQPPTAPSISGAARPAVPQSITLPVNWGSVAAPGATGWGLTVADAQTVGWGIVVAWIVAAASAFVGRAFRDSAGVFDDERQ